MESKRIFVNTGGVHIEAKIHSFSEILWRFLIDGIIWILIFVEADYFCHVTYLKIKRGIPMLCRFRFASDLRSRDSKPLYSVNMFHCQLSVDSRIFIILSKSPFDSIIYLVQSIKFTSVHIWIYLWSIRPSVHNRRLSDLRILLHGQKPVHIKMIIHV